MQHKILVCLNKLNFLTQKSGFSRRVSDEGFHDFFCEISQSWMFNYLLYNCEISQSFVNFQFPTIRRNFHIFSIAYLSEVVSSHFFVGTSIFFSFVSIRHRPTKKTMTSEVDRQRVPQENMTRLSGINRHNKWVQDGVGVWCPDIHVACTFHTGVRHVIDCV